MRTRVVNIRDERGDVFIGRPGPFGNPFIIGRDGDRREVIEKHRRYLKKHPELVERIKKELTGKILKCYCYPLICHGDTLVKICEGEEW